MIPFEPTGQLLTDLENSITNQIAMRVSYTDKKGNYSERIVAPLEIRDNVLWLWDMEKWGLRCFILANIGSFEVIDQTFNKEDFRTS